MKIHIAEISPKSPCNFIPRQSLQLYLVLNARMKKAAIYSHKSNFNFLFKILRSTLFLKKKDKSIFAVFLFLYFLSLGWFGVDVVCCCLRVFYLNCHRLYSLLWGFQATKFIRESGVFSRTSHKREQQNKFKMKRLHTGIYSVYFSKQTRQEIPIRFFFL